MSRSLYEQAGGMDTLRAVIEDFYDRVFDDVMIGFFFRDAAKARLVEKELELAAGLLGAQGVTYTGEPLKQAHARHPIMGGHFERRKQLLDDTIRDHGLPEAVREEWIAHTELLRPLVTDYEGGDCE